MKRHLTIALPACLGLALILGGIKYMQISAAIAGNSANQPPPDAVTTTRAERTSWPQLRAAVGNAVAIKGATLSAEASGRVSKVNFESGAEVTAGQLLVALDTSVEEAELEAARARLELATVNAKRERSLRERNANSKADLDNAEALLREARAGVKQLEAEIALKQIIAPFDGRAGIRQVQVGQTIAQGTPVVPVQSYSPIYVNFSLPQRDLGALNVGQSVVVTAEGFGDREFAGTLTAISSEVDAATRNVNLQATLPNKEEAVRPGMFVSVSLNLGRKTDIVTVPTSSVSYTPYGNFVYIVKNAEKEGAPRPVEATVVQLGEKRGDLSAILSGLEGGEEVVSSGLFKLNPNSRVIVNNSVTPEEQLSPTPKDT